MLKEFIDDLNELLHANPYSNVDILPLVEKYTDGKQKNEISQIRIDIQRLIHDLEEAKLIKTNNEYHSQLSYKHRGEYSEEPILIRSTQNFEEKYKKDKSPSKSGEYHFHAPVDKFIKDSFNDNEGVINYDSTLLSDKAITQSVTTMPSTKQSTPTKIIWYKRTWFKYFLFPIVTGILVLLLYWVIKYLTK